MFCSPQALILAQGLVQQQELIVKTVITRGGLANPAIRAAKPQSRANPVLSGELTSGSEKFDNP